MRFFKELVSPGIARKLYDSGYNFPADYCYSVILGGLPGPGPVYITERCLRNKPGHAEDFITLPNGDIVPDKLPAPTYGELLDWLLNFGCYISITIDPAFIVVSDDFPLIQNLVATVSRTSEVLVFENLDSFEKILDAFSTIIEKVNIEAKKKFGKEATLL